MATPLKVKTLSDKATFPSRESRSAGYDLYSATETKVSAGGIALIPTDLIIAIPGGLYGLIALRSALTWNPWIWIREAVFDADYRVFCNSVFTT